jgi:hypothetical protein
MKKIRIAHDDPRKREKLDELIRNIRRAFSNPSAYTDVEYVSGDDGIYLTITAMTEPIPKPVDPEKPKGQKFKDRKPKSRPNIKPVADVPVQKVRDLPKVFAPPAVAEAVTGPDETGAEDTR